MEGMAKKEEGMQHKEEEKRHLLAQKAFHRPFAASEVETLTLLSTKKERSNASVNMQRHCYVLIQEKAVPCGHCLCGRSVLLQN